MKEKVISKITFIISGSCDNFDITLKDNNGEEIKPQIEIVNRNSSFGQTNATKVTHSFTPEGDNCGAIYKHNGTYTLTVKGMDRCPGVIDHEFEIYIERECFNCLFVLILRHFKFLFFLLDFEAWFASLLYHSFKKERVYWIYFNLFLFSVGKI